MSISEPERWLEDHGSALYSFAILHTHDSHRAEDLIQETLLAALKSSKNFHGDSSVRTWLIGILKHKIMDEFRRQSREGYTSNSADDVFEVIEKQQIAEAFTESGSWKHPIEEGATPSKTYFVMNSGYLSNVAQQGFPQIWQSFSYYVTYGGSKQKKCVRNSTLLRLISGPHCIVPVWECDSA